MFVLLFLGRNYNWRNGALLTSSAEEFGDITALAMNVIGLKFMFT